MACRVPHDLLPESAGSPARPELHALAMPQHARGEIDDILLETERLPGMRMLRVYVPAPAMRGSDPLPVLLVNDGHKAFEPSNHRVVPAWQQSGTLQLHRLMDGLLCEGAVQPAVVVAIATHSGSRADQYVPVRASLGQSRFGGQGDVYLDVLEHEVLPAVQRALGFVRLSERPEHRVLVGMSIGGIAALHGALTRPDVFGGAIALSPSAWVGDGFLLRTVEANDGVRARIAADIGDAEKAPIREHCGRLFAALTQRGNGSVFAQEVGGVHHEDSWRERLPRLLRHVLGA